MRRRSVLEAGVLAAAGAFFPKRQPTNLSVRGANIIETPTALFGSAAARESLDDLAAIGANWIAMIPFFWQASTHSADLVRGTALPMDRLRAGIRQANEAGLAVLVKPHVWVPQSWAGAVIMTAEKDWAGWFGAYRQALLEVAEVAEGEGAKALSVGTELRGTSWRPEWREILEATRKVFSGKLTYVAHGAEEAMKIAFWQHLDVLSVSLYPSLGAPHDKRKWRDAMAEHLVAVRTQATHAGKPVWIAEIGLRSATGATFKPWESAEERAAEPALLLQSDVLAAWFDEMRRANVDGGFVWRWFTDPDAGGPRDTDFTVQNKPAEGMLRNRWLKT